jgi:hypothetical protein
MSDCQIKLAVVLAVIGYCTDDDSGYGAVAGAFIGIIVPWLMPYLEQLRCVQ